MTILRHECECGADRASHYRDPTTGKWGASLALGGVECKEYRDKHAPKPEPHAANCHCRKQCHEKRLRGH